MILRSKKKLGEEEEGIFFFSLSLLGKFVEAAGKLSVESQELYHQSEWKVRLESREKEKESCLVVFFPCFLNRESATLIGQSQARAESRFNYRRCVDPRKTNAQQGTLYF